MNILNSIFSWVMKRRLHQIEFFLQNPHDVQNDWMNRLVFSAKKTEFGIAHGFQNIKTYDDFANRIPLMTYEELKKYVIRIKRGEQNIIWPSEIKWFAKSSGTENDKSKYIPVSKESLKVCHYTGGTDMLALYYQNIPDSRLFAGKTLIFGGSNSVNQFSPDSYYGDLSSIIIDNIPFWVEFRRIPKKEIALMGEWEKKIEMLAKSTSKEDVTNISGVPSWTLVILKKMLEQTGAKTIHEVWPNLELFMHGGVSFAPYRQQFKNLINDSKMNYLEAYNASEGLFGIQNDLSDDGLLLMLDYGIFYEFIPVENAIDEHPKTIQLGDVEVSKEYEVVISTNAGLWRYRMGDTVMFKSVNPYKIVVSGRVKHFINVFGEELMVHNAEKAMEYATSRTNSVVAEFTAAPIYLSTSFRGAHEWVIEFEKVPDSVGEFTKLLDDGLKLVNSDYEAKRAGSLVLDSPRLTVVPKGTFYQWFRSRNKLGGQNKIPRLFNNRKYVELMIQFCNSTHKLKAS